VVGELDDADVAAVARVACRAGADPVGTETQRPYFCARYSMPCRYSLKPAGSFEYWT
jgi:hypothetical protein